MRVFARALSLKPKRGTTSKQRKVRGWRSFVGVPIAGAHLTLHIGDEEFEVTADRGGVIDQIIPEPVGGAQRDRKTAIADVGKALEAMLKDLSKKKPDALVQDRRKKYLEMGGKGLAA
ncbi:MAG: hypothetical protein RL187_931 [Actinomycetota bacterium]